MCTILAGDIGGTKTILRLVKTLAPRSGQSIPQLTTVYEQTYPSQDFANLSAMIGQFLAEVAAQTGKSSQIQVACFGIAGPVIGNTSKLTNLSWFLDAHSLEQELDCSKVALINDFASVGYGVLGLTATDLAPLQSATPNPHAPIAVIGAGTGLGQGFLIPGATGYQVFPSEGGHVDFAPCTPTESELLYFLQEHQQLKRVSVERIVSGNGIVSIYEFMRHQGNIPESPQLARMFQAWKQQPLPTESHPDLAAAIAQAALNQTDPLCQKVMTLFVEAYGAEAGNLALKLLPYGGLYLAGGIAAKILPLLQRGEFLEAFRTKGRVSPLLQNVPVHVILNPNVGLIGAAFYAAQLAAAA
jgi:glucokinase